MMPKDPVMLLSYVNTQLRDFLPVARRILRGHADRGIRSAEKLALIDYEYDEKTNQFV